MTATYILEPILPILFEDVAEQLVFFILYHPCYCIFFSAAKRTFQKYSSIFIADVLNSKYIVLNSEGMYVFQISCIALLISDQWFCIIYNGTETHSVSMLLNRNKTFNKSEYISAGAS